MRSASFRKPSALFLSTLCLGGLGSLSALSACTQGEKSPAIAASTATAPTTSVTIPVSPPPASASTTPPAASSAPKTEGIPKNLNVIVLSIDSLRADMPWSGYPRPIAPRLTELEKKSVSYTQSYAVSSYTSMSVGGFLAGRIPSELSRSGYFFGQYPENEPNYFFPKALQKGKVKTIAVHSHAYFSKGRSGFEQGFDVWELTPGITFNNTTDTHITSPKTVELMKKVLDDKELETRPFFAWTHFTDPHDVYMKHEGIDWGKTERDKYDGEITYTDKHVGELLDFIAKKSWADRTLIVITSDHGEAFGEHGRTRHGFEIWENLVRVPLFFYVPGVSARRIDEPRSGADLAATFVELLGLPADSHFTGKSLAKELYGAKAEPRDVVVDLPTTSDNEKRRALIRGKHKLLCLGNDKNCRLFDLSTDPTEDKPITKGEKWSELMAAYTSYVGTLKELAPTKCTAGCLNGGYRKK